MKKKTAERIVELVKNGVDVKKLNALTDELTIGLSTSRNLLKVREVEIDERKIITLDTPNIDIAIKTLKAFSYQGYDADTGKHELGFNSWLKNEVSFASFIFMFHKLHKCESPNISYLAEQCLMNFKQTYTVEALRRIKKIGVVKLGKINHANKQDVETRIYGMFERIYEGYYTSGFFEYKNEAWRDICKLYYGYYTYTFLKEYFPEKLNGLEIDSEEVEVAYFYIQQLEKII